MTTKTRQSGKCGAQLYLDALRSAAYLCSKEEPKQHCGPLNSSGAGFAVVAKKFRNMNLMRVELVPDWIVVAVNFRKMTMTLVELVVRIGSTSVGLVLDSILERLGTQQKNGAGRSGRVGARSTVPDALQAFIYNSCSTYIWATRKTMTAVELVVQDSLVVALEVWKTMKTPRELIRSWKDLGPSKRMELGGVGGLEPAQNFGTTPVPDSSVVTLDVRKMNMTLVKLVLDWIAVAVNFGKMTMTLVELVVPDWNDDCGVGAGLDLGTT
ncbi:hypothetical protein FN846DRAFT_913283 [Sphaerosporella brunnea]|uniref:Uncharacterized protein n=1 Tax=Sphaerosporella brunnea TaxID=1250544 RepID=A0A5J5EH95_9PEZI|nr:hypothetical protein FN846DRAFT_913283 [Sphaerosporella brunnea]